MRRNKKRPWTAEEGEKLLTLAAAQRLTLSIVAAMKRKSAVNPALRGVLYADRRRRDLGLCRQPEKRAAEAGRRYSTHSRTVELPLPAYFIRAIGLCSWIEVIPTRLLPGHAPIAEVHGGLIQYRFEACPIGIWNAR